MNLIMVLLRIKGFLKKLYREGKAKENRTSKIKVEVLSTTKISCMELVVVNQTGHFICSMELAQKNVSNTYKSTFKVRNIYIYHSVVLLHLGGDDPSGILLGEVMND